MKRIDDLLSLRNITASEVHIWHATLEQPENAARWLWSILSEDEMERAERFHFDRHRRAFIAGRGILRHLLSLYTGIEPSRVQIQYAQNGKPILPRVEGGSDIRFNLSHSGGKAVYAFTRGREVGVDIEHLHPIQEMDQISERNFSVREYRTLQSLPQEDRLKAFYLCWTRKEAFIKAIGEGISFPLQQFDVTLTPGEPARLLSVFGSPQEASHWSMVDLKTPEGYVAALVVKGRDPSLSEREWNSFKEFNDLEDTK